MDNVEVMVYETRKAAEEAASIRNLKAKGSRNHEVVETSSGFLLERSRQSGRVDRFLKSNMWMRVKP